MQYLQAVLCSKQLTIVVKLFFLIIIIDLKLKASVHDGA
jgi:hypothetical protein